ncbi:EthD family reductase [Acidovorax sp. D2M1]|uniref:EthD family reductase n=1 Tax=Acidovorax benzenivorans TaxID=2987520 RepID=A0ABT5RZY2_9BURK|nr:EthD family reductase [Acidovorax benzenivorans]MDD2179266.1 EthD family reductase [Acidovorax benzenivorans]
MIKMIAMLKRKEHLSHEAFVEHWEKTHGPLAFNVPGLRRYVQSHILSEQFRDDIPSMNFEADGIAELWFDDAEALTKAHHSAEMQRLLADGATFIGEIKTYLVDEIPVPHVSTM